MADNTNIITIDGAELFSDCLAQATMVVKQVMPIHYANATPDAELDVRDLIGHMLAIVESLPAVLSGAKVKLRLSDDMYDEDELDVDSTDLSSRWQLAADQAEAISSEVDLEDMVLHDGEQTAIENIMTRIAGDLLIHTWDLGEAIGMPVRFKPNVAEAVMETTIVPNKLMLSSHMLFAEPIDPPANADLQARLLALFGRSHAWRSAS